MGFGTRPDHAGPPPGALGASPSRPSASPSDPPSHRSFLTRHRRAVLGLVLLNTLVIAVVCVWLLSTYYPLFPASHGPKGSGSGTTNPSEGFSCQQVAGATPGALAIPATNPTSTVGPGGSVTVSLEVTASPLPPGASSVRVSVPSASVIFPLAPNGSLTLYLAPRALVATGAWSTPSADSVSKTLTAAATFSSTNPATLTTHGLSVMAIAPYGSTVLEFRWMWSVSASGAANGTAGPWTQPSAAGPLPSILYPSPQVQLLGNPPQTATIGSNYTAYLGGATSNQTFTLKLENASTGHDLQVVTEVAPFGNTTPFAAFVPLLAQGGPIAPGTYLVHVHNVCDAILFSLTVHLTYSSIANVTVLLSPASCGSVTLNGKGYANGSVAVLRPGPVSVSLQAPSCTGHAFVSWATAGGTYVAQPSAPATQIVVSADGVVTARFG